MREEFHSYETYVARLPILRILGNCVYETMH